MATYVKSEGEITNIFTGTQPLSTAATYSDVIELQRCGYFGIWLSAGPASATSGAGLTMWYELSPTSVAADFACAGTVAVNMSALSAALTGTSIAPYPMPFIRFGLSATAMAVTSAARVSAKLFSQ